ncbi:hypothetical protein SNEBB_004289 [Seison nebaliae]|nr:hypothetical protein SNEBB_004289 [Seison nebaliae]
MYQSKYNDMFNYQDNFRKSQRSCIDPFPRPPEYYKKVTPPMNKPMVQSGYNFNVESFHRNWSDCLYHKKSFGNGEEEDDDLEEYVLESKKLKLKEKLKIILLLTLKYLLILLSILFILLSQVIYLNIGLRKSSSDKSMSSIQHYGNNFCSTDERACCTQYLQLLKTYKKYGEFNEIINLCKNNQLSKWSIEIVHHRTQFLLITIILLIIYSMELSHIIWYEWKIVKFNTITLSTLQLSLIIIFELFLMISQIFIFQYIILINNRYLFELIIFQLSFLILIDYLYRLLIKYLSTNKYSFEFTTIRCNDGFSRKFTISHYPDNMKQLRNLILNNYSKKFSKLNPSSLHLLPTDCDIINIFLRSILTSKIPSYSPPTTNSTVPWNETNSSIESASTTTTPGTKILKLDGEDKSKNSNGIFLGIGDLWGNLVMNMEQRNLIATSFTYISSSFSMWTKTIKCVEESGNIYQATYDELAQLVVGCLSNINISYVISREDKLQLINQIASCIRWECKFKQSNFIPNDTIENSNNHSFQDLNEKFDYSYYSSKSDQNLYYFYINSFSNSHKIRLLTVIRRILKEKWAK